MACAELLKASAPPAGNEKAPESLSLTSFRPTSRVSTTADLNAAAERTSVGTAGIEQKAGRSVAWLTPAAQAWPIDRPMSEAAQIDGAAKPATIHRTFAIDTVCVRAFIRAEVIGQTATERKGALVTRGSGQ